MKSHVSFFFLLPRKYGFNPLEIENAALVEDKFMGRH